MLRWSLALEPLRKTTTEPEDAPNDWHPVAQSSRWAGFLYRDIQKPTASLQCITRLHTASLG